MKKAIGVLILVGSSKGQFSNELFVKNTEHLKQEALFYWFNVTLFRLKYNVMGYEASTWQRDSIIAIREKIDATPVFGILDDFYLAPSRRTNEKWNVGNHKVYIKPGMQSVSERQQFESYLISYNSVAQKLRKIIDIYDRNKAGFDNEYSDTIPSTASSGTEDMIRRHFRSFSSEAMTKKTLGEVLLAFNALRMRRALGPEFENTREKSVPAILSSFR